MLFRVIKIICVLLCLIGIAFGVVYFISSKVSYTRHIELPAHLRASTSTVVVDIASIEKPLWGVVPTASTTALGVNDTRNWKTNSKPEWEYQISYPQGLGEHITKGGVVLTFPRTSYFHWPLLDDARITVDATTTCPVFDVQGASTSTITINETDFYRIESTDAGAGQIGRKLVYVTATDMACYIFELNIYGARGADLYVDQANKITEYNDVHLNDMTNVVRIFNTIASGFTLIPTGEGVSEDLSPP